LKIFFPTMEDFQNPFQEAHFFNPIIDQITDNLSLGI
jgi:hypothetical protein